MISKKEYFEKMRKNNIGLQVHYIPIHLQPYYKKNFGFKENDFTTAESFYGKEVSLPIYPTLQNEDLKYIVNKLKEFAI
jgi:dTDP-4-amino-4,6-dideoxygalactose transaminase